MRSQFIKLSSLNKSTAFKRQQGSVMVESAMGMIVIMIMMMAMIWYFQVMDFAVKQEITAGVELRKSMIDANDSCYELVPYQARKTIDSSFDLGKFIGSQSQRFTFDYNIVGWSGTCQDLEQSRFHDKNQLRRFRGPDLGFRFSW